MSKLFPKRVTVARLLLIAAVLLVVFFIANGRLNESIRNTEGQIGAARLEKSTLQKQEASIRQELSLSGTDAYIETVARDKYGYLMPGEIQFVITNPEALYGVDGSAQAEVVEIGQE